MLTGCFFGPLPAGHLRISIARSTPRGMRDLPQIRELAPGASYFRTATVDQYIPLYAEGLARLDPMAIVERIDQLAAGRIPVLCCWEKPNQGDFCHRALISVWLCEHLGLVVEELGCEGQGFSGSHPLLPPQYRLPVAA